MTTETINTYRVYGTTPLMGKTDISSSLMGSLLSVRKEPVKTLNERLEKRLNEVRDDFDYVKDIFATQEGSFDVNPYI